MMFWLLFFNHKSACQNGTNLHAWVFEKCENHKEQKSSFYKVFFLSELCIAGVLIK